MVNSPLHLPDISLGQCLGLRLIYSTVSNSDSVPTNSEKKELSDIFAKAFTTTFIIPAAVLLLGYIYSHYTFGGLLK